MSGLARAQVEGKSLGRRRTEAAAEAILELRTRAWACWRSAGSWAAARAGPRSSEWSRGTRGLRPTRGPATARARLQCE